MIRYRLTAFPLSHKCFTDQFISPNHRFFSAFRQQIVRIALLLVPADKCIWADAVQFNVDVLVDAHQIQFSVLHFNVDFAGKICTCELPEVFLRDRYLVRLHRMLRFFPIQDIGDAFPKPVLVQRFIVGQNDDAEIILKEILRIRGNPVGVTMSGPG